MSMLKSENVAMPLAAATLSVPERVPPPALFPNAIVTLSVAVVTSLSNASRTVTTTAGVIELPATVFIGCVVIASFAGEAGLMVNVELVAPVNVPLVAASVYPADDLSMLRFENVAIPLAAATGGKYLSLEQVHALDIPVGGGTRPVGILKIWPWCLLVGLVGYLGELLYRRRSRGVSGTVGAAVPGIRTTR